MLLRIKMFQNCPKESCLCKSCPFNRQDSICLGCIECHDHKSLSAVEKCSSRKLGNWEYFGVVHIEDRYELSVPMGICSVIEYFPITKEEYDTFDSWPDKKILDIQNRKYKQRGNR